VLNVSLSVIFQSCFQTLLIIQTVNDPTETIIYSIHNSLLSYTVVTLRPQCTKPPTSPSYKMHDLWLMLQLSPTWYSLPLSFTSSASIPDSFCGHRRYINFYIHYEQTEMLCVCVCVCAARACTHCHSWWQGHKSDYILTARCTIVHKPLYYNIHRTHTHTHTHTAGTRAREVAEPDFHL